jgi:hypothetical protein
MKKINPSYVPSLASLFESGPAELLIQLTEKAISSGMKNVKIHHYLNGIRQEAPDSMDFLEQLRGPGHGSALPCSFRITNAQLLDPRLNEICTELEAKFKRVFSCNLYFTPKEGCDCFDWHSDYGEIFVTQLMGAKRWFWRLAKDGRPYLHLKQGPIESEAGQQLEHIDLLAGELLQVAYGQTHKASHIGGGPSLHLTFSSWEVELKDVMTGLFNYASRFALGEELGRVDMSEAGLQMTVNRVLTNVNAMDVARFIDIFLMSDFKKQNSIRKEGIDYES